MPDTTPDLAELRRLLDCANSERVMGASLEMDYSLMRKSTRALFIAAVNALPALLDAAAERDALAAKVEAVRALADWHETKADKARRFPGPESRALVMEKAAQVHSDAAWRIRRALDAMGGES